jgi:hypothetical protein
LDREIAPRVRTSSDSAGSPLPLVISSFRLNKSAMASEYAWIAADGVWLLSWERSAGMRPICETTVAALAWVAAGNCAPICLVKLSVRAAAASVAAWALACAAMSGAAPSLSPLSTAPDSFAAVADAMTWSSASTAPDMSRSFSIACASAVTCSPRTASCVVRANELAVPMADATRSPPNTSPMTTAVTMTATSRRDTGQLRSAREARDGCGRRNDFRDAAAWPAGRSLPGSSGLVIGPPSPVFGRATPDHLVRYRIMTSWLV